MRSTRAAIAAALLIACGGPTETPDDAGDAGAPLDSGVDSGPVTPPCESNTDCDDGVFCNGAEACRPGDPLADAVGCVPGPARCAAMQTCNEAAARCESDCDVAPDADDDHYRAASCGGNDCDDSDGTVNPGVEEVCDAEGRDEDCDPDTLASPSETDVDGDGYVAMTCCNIQRSGALLCGLDCDDGTTAARPGYPETCDEIDNDCDGSVDERVRTTYYRDGDGDLYGDDADTMQACMQPDGYTANAGDCDDAMASVHPTADETCNLADDDCDTNIDEGAPPATDSCGACGFVCPADWTCEAGSCVDHVVEVDGGSNLICARVATGRVFCWGASAPWSAGPSEVAGLAPAGDISVGGGTVCAVSGAGVVCYGRDFITGGSSGTTTSYTIPGGAHQVTVGSSHACAVASDRAVYCWGDNDSGQLGIGTVTDRASPVRVGTLRADEVAAGSEHTCARDGGTVYCWGANAVRQLGNGSTTPSLTPVVADVPATAEHVGVGPHTSCASAASTVYCWGSNDRGQAGSYPGFSGGTAIEPDAVDMYPLLSSLAIDSSLSSYRPLGGGIIRRAETCALASTGRVYCWGDALPPPLAGGSHQARQVTSLTDVVSLTTGAAVGLSSAGVFTCAADMDGSLWCWGQNDGNILHTADTSALVAMPSRVSDLPPAMPPVPR